MLRSFFSLLINCFPFVRIYRLRRKIGLRRKKLYGRFYKNSKKPIKRSRIQFIRTTGKI